MGNAAGCHACGSDATFRSSSIEEDSNHPADYYGAADPGADADHSLVRGQ